MPIARFEMPDGRIARFEVPEGTSPEEAQSLVQQELQQETTSNENITPDYTTGEAFSKAFTRGRKQLGSALFDVLPAAVASSVGADEYAKQQMEEAADTQRQIQQFYRPEVASYKDIDSLGSLGTYAVETLGEQIPNLATAIGPGIAGRVGAGVLTRRGLTQAAERAAAEAGVTDPALISAYTQQAIKTAAPEIASSKALGQNVGIYLGSYAQNFPEVFQNIYDETGSMEPGTAALFSSVSAGLDSAFPAYMFKKIAGPNDKLLKTAITEKILEKSGTNPGLLRRVATSGAKGMALEGLTEGAQEAISIAAERFIADNPDVFGSKEWDRIVESGIRGSIAGLGFGLPGGIRSEPTPPAAPTTEQPGPQPDVTGIKKETLDGQNIPEAIGGNIPVSGQPAEPGLPGDTKKPVGLGIDDDRADAGGLEGGEGKQPDTLKSVGKSGNVYELNNIPQGRVSFGAFTSLETTPIAQDKELFRQLNTREFDNLLMDNERNQVRSADSYEAFVTDNKDLALGQEENKGGIQITFRPNTISGQENVKPGTQGELGEVVGREFKTNAIAPKAIQSIDVPKNQLKNLSGLSERLIKEHFDGVKNADGSYTFTRRIEAAPKAEPKASDKPIKEFQDLPMEDIQNIYNAWHKISKTSFNELYDEDADKVVKAYQTGNLTPDFADSIDEYYQEQRVNQFTTAETAPSTGESAASLTDHLKNEFGNNITLAQKRGTLNIVDSVDNLPDEIKTKIAPNAVGAYSKGKSYLIANRISKENARKTLLHEVGEHYGLERMTGKDIYKQILRQVKNLKVTDPTIKNAWEEVTKLYPELAEGSDGHVREVLAKIGETSPENTLWRRVVGAVKQFLTKLGLYNPNKFTTADIQDMILHSLRTALKRELPTAKVEAGVPAVQMSKSAPGAVDPQKAKQFMSVIDNVTNSLPVYNTKLGQEVRNIYSNLPDQVRALGLSFLSLPQKIDIWGSKIPAMKTLLKALELRASRSDELRQTVDKNIFEGIDLLKKFSKAEIDRFNAIVTDISAEKVTDKNGEEHGIDPRKGAKYYDPTNPLIKQFESLDPELQKLAIKYANEFENMIDQMFVQIEQLSGKSIAAKMRENFEKNKIPFYMPLRRKGNYFLEYTDKDGVLYSIASESRAESDHIKAQVEAQGATNTKSFFRIKETNYKETPPLGFVKEIVDLLEENIKVDENNSDARAHKESLINEVYKTYIELFPDESIRKQMQHRKGTKGYIKDVVGGYAEVGARLSNALANLEHRPEIDKALAKIKEEVNIHAENNKGDPDNYAIAQVAQELMEQKKFLDNPVADSISANLSWVSYIWNIAGNVSSAIINLTQIPMVVMPMLGGEYTWAESFKAMKNAYGMYFKGGLDMNRRFMPDYTFGANLKPGDKHYRLYEAAKARSAVRRGVGYELTELRRVSAEDFTGKRAKIETALGWVFQNSERMNREVTLIAAYDLALKQNGGNVDAAIEKALDLTNRAHSHALSEAGPKMFQTGFGKVAFTFKRFAQTQIYNVARLFYLATRDMPTKDREIARKQLLGIFGMTYAFSGAQGLPLYGAINMLGSAIAAMFGDDEPYDFDEEVRELIGDLGYKGPMNQLLNIDIASRTGFNGMVWRDDKRRLSEAGFGPYFAEHFFGPAYQAIAVNPVRAAKLWNEGHTERAIETVVPSFAKNIMKGFRYASEGALTTNGAKVIDDPNAYNSFMQIWGFTNTDLAEAYARAGAMKEAERKIQSRRTNLLDLHYLARINGDDDTISELRGKIADYNKSFPKYRITSDTLSRSFRGHEERNRKSTDGVYLNKKLKDYLIEEQGS
jgi:hypothetical protein